MNVAEKTPCCDNAQVNHHKVISCVIVRYGATRMNVAEPMQGGAGIGVLHINCNSDQAGYAIK